MPQNPQLRVGDVGSTIRLTVKEAGQSDNLATAAVKQFKFRKPDGSVLTVAAAFVSDGTDGKLQYVTVANDLDQEGPWTGQVYVEIGQEKWHTSQFSFQVASNIEPKES